MVEVYKPESVGQNGEKDELLKCSVVNEALQLLLGLPGQPVIIVPEIS
jgi:hypothetical protein